MKPLHHNAQVAATTHSSVASGIDTDALKVLRNTYRLLAMTLAFSAAVAATSAALKLPHPGLLLTLGGYFGLLFLTSYLRNSAWGLLSVFALTGFMGYTLGPLLAAYLSLPNGSTMIATALGATGAVFLGLSWYAKQDNAVNMLQFGTFLFVGVLTAFCLGLAAYFFAMPALSAAVSGLFVLLMSGLILYQTQDILHGGERNYIMATVTLYVALYNLFVSLLQLLGFFGSDE
tara:strand:+ start:36417 stop:37112 length:696 start_codon:yes stop_codon:yes gene_type:complete